MNIPEEIKQEAKSLIDQFGCNFEHLGRIEGREAFQFVFPKDMDLGFPRVYLFDTNSKVATEITGFEALRLIRLSRKQ